ncbi:hypothetical protein BH11PLA2_BH11PLA2_08570 [soil metagenome]
MVNLDAILTALNQPSPWTGMRELAEKMLDTGMTLLAARDELYVFAPHVEDAGLSEDQVDAFFDTLDDLAGWCSQERKFVQRVATPVASVIASSPTTLFGEASKPLHAS